ncbi:MAG: DUF3861 domain-containing protein [Acidobacteriaceae bacterium]|nr:DUF3861 domain-containing protein [Acidobacteriaceae bacterium]
MGMYGYQVTVERHLNTGGEMRGEAGDRLSFLAENHDDLFRILELMRSKNTWDEDMAAQLAIGLKLFSEVVIKHRNDPLFEPLMLPIREFIGRLKAMPAAEASAIEPARS